MAPLVGLKLLRNPAVIGHLTPGRLERVNGRKVRTFEEPIEGAFPAIIEEADWLAVRSLKDGHAASARGRGAAGPLASLLGGLARCPICGNAMTRVNKGTKKKAGQPKLVCTVAKAGGGCVYHGVGLEAVEAAIREKAAWLVESIPAGAGCAELDAKAQELEGGIAGLRSHLDDLVDAVARSGPSKSAAERLARLGAEIDTARAELEAVDERRRLLDGGLIRERRLTWPAPPSASMARRGSR